MGICFCAPKNPIFLTPDKKTTVSPFEEINYKMFKTNFIKTEINNNQSPEEIYIINENEELNISNKKKIHLEDFQFLKVIGRGSYGKVMLVQKKDTKKHYAMKIIKKQDIENRNQKLHTKSERIILENMNSKFIVQLFYAFQTPDKLYLVMDFMIGGELFFHLRKIRRLSEKKAIFYLTEIILAIEHLHKNDIIYRDLKPENILLDKKGHIKLADFGLSKQGVGINEKSYTFCGTPEYLAPEILLGQGHNKSADWWSLGALMYEMLAGAPPFYSKDRNEMFRNRLEKEPVMKTYFSKNACDLLKALLVNNPEKRIGNSFFDAEEIKKHAFFNEINWEKVRNKEYDPPIKPDIKNFEDLSCFDKMFTDEALKETPTNGKNETYSNFSYCPRDVIISPFTSHIYTHNDSIIHTN